MSFIFCGSLKAQQQTLPQFPASLQSHPVLNFAFTVSSMSQNNTMYSAFTNCPQMKPAIIKPISIKDMPFFCMMECRVRQHTNIWIKLRAGDDASYRKMINSNLRER